MTQRSGGIEREPVRAPSTPARDRRHAEGVASLQRAGNRATQQLVQRAGSGLDVAIAQTQGGGRAWDRFKASLDMLLVAAKYASNRTDDARGALHKLIEAVYAEFTGGSLKHAEIREWMLPKKRRLAQILPPGQAGSDLLWEVVTVLTMTSDAQANDEYNAWATDILVDATARATG